MFYEPAKRNHGLPHDPLLAIVAPRPIGWISSLSATGIVNLAPYSYFNLLCTRPPIVGFSSTTRKDSSNNVEETKEFVCNLTVRPLLEQINLTSATLPHGESEIELAKIETVPSLLVKPPRVAASPCALECVWTETILIKDHSGKASENYLVLGEVVGVHIDEQFIIDGRVDITKMRTIARCGYMDYATVEAVTALPRPTITSLKSAR